MPHVLNIGFKRFLTAETTFKVVRVYWKPRSSMKNIFISSLLTFDRNYGSISHRFKDISTCLWTRS